MKTDPILQLWQLDRQCEAMDPALVQRRRLRLLRARARRIRRGRIWRRLMALLKGRGAA